MNPERWRRIEELYNAAQEREPEERGAFLAGACRGDDELKREIERLLAKDSGGKILDSPVAQLLASRPLSPGDKLGPYEIVSRIGAGGMGAVFKARDPRVGRIVAIKVPSAQFSERFEREARAVAALNHPNICTLYDVGRQDGVDFIVMEFVAGKTLGQLISPKGMPLGDTLQIAVQIADALARAHAAGIVHRDLKPANVMVDDHGLAKVLDFGLAKLVPHFDSEQSTQTEAGAILGTLSYMSPEQAEGKPVDVRSDIFSFGAVLYEMTTGQRAFRGETAMSTISAILRDEPKPVSQLASGIPADLEKIVTRCLRKDPPRRTQSMADVRVALLEVKDSSESGRGPGKPIAPLVRKRTWLWAGAAAIFFSLLSAGLWLMKDRVSQLPQPLLVPVTTDPGYQSNPSFSPDGKQIAYSWFGRKDDKQSIYVKLVGETQALRLTTSPTADGCPVWTPDGKRIAFRRFGKEGGIYTVSALGGTERKVAGLAAICRMSWSPDGKWLAISLVDQNDRGILLVPASGGEPRRISNPKSPAEDRSPVFSPDGHSLAYAGCTSGISCDVHIQDLDAGYSPRGSPRQIMRQGTAIWGLTWSRDGNSLIYSASQTAGTIPYLWRTGINGRQPPLRLEIAGPGASDPAVSPSGNRLVFSRNNPDADIWRYHLSGGMEPLVVSSLADYNPQYSPDGSKILFQSSRSGDDEIWVAQADGSQPVQLTIRVGRHQGAAKWSPDGRWIAFHSQSQDGRMSIFVMDTAGGQPRKITTGPADEELPNWSRDGKWLYSRSTRTGTSQIWRVPFAGGTPEQVTTNGGYIAFESVDGQTLFYTKAISGPLFSRPLSGGAERQVLPYLNLVSFAPVKEGIYYVGRPGAESFPLMFFQFSTQTSRVLTKIEGRTWPGLCVSPDGKTVLFIKLANFGAHLMMIENVQ